MTPRAQTHPLDDARMWRKLLGRSHPDGGGDHDLFIWCGTLWDVVCSGELQVHTRPEQQHSAPSTAATDDGDPARVPYSTGLDFEVSTRIALRVKGPYAYLLALLSYCHPIPHLAYEEARGASYKRLAAIAHTWGMSKDERIGFYRVAEEIPLSDRHAGHVLSKLKKRRLGCWIRLDVGSVVPGVLSRCRFVFLEADVMCERWQSQRDPLFAGSLTIHTVNDEKGDRCLTR